MSNENSNSNDSTITTPVRGRRATKTPRYVAFAEALRQRFEKAGIPLVATEEDAIDGFNGPKDWVLFEVSGTGDKIYVNRTRYVDPTRVETTLPLESLPISMVVEDMRGRNGRIEARVRADVGLIDSMVIPVIARRFRNGDTIRGVGTRKTPAVTTQG